MTLIYITGEKLMKKILFFLIALQCVLLQGATRFNYLSKLDERSIIRRECEQIKRGWVFQGEKEQACNSLDIFMTKSTKVALDLINKSVNKKQMAQIMLHRDLPQLLDNKDINDFLNYTFETIIPTNDLEAAEKEAVGLFLPLKKEIMQAAGEGVDIDSMYNK